PWSSFSPKSNRRTPNGVSCFASSWSAASPNSAPPARSPPPTAVVSPRSSADVLRFGRPLQVLKPAVPFNCPAVQPASRLMQPRGVHREPHVPALLFAIDQTCAFKHPDVLDHSRSADP